MLSLLIFRIFLMFLSLAVKLNDMHQFDPINLQWNAIQSSNLLGDFPSPRSEFGFETVRGNIYVYGGRGQSGEMRKFAFHKRYEG